MQTDSIKTRLPALIFCLGLLGIAQAAVASECDNWQSVHPEWLWCDDFEDTAALNTRYEDVSTNGMGASTDDALDGTMSLKQSYTPGQVDAGWVIKVDNGGFPEHIFYRYYHKFPAGYSRFPNKMARIGFRRRAGSWTPVFMVHTWLIPATGELTLDVLARNSTQANPSGYLPVRLSGVNLSGRLDQWVAVEVEVKLNTPGATDGIMRMWLDDNLVIDSTNVDLRGSTTDLINEVMLDTYWNDGSPTSLNRYYDNFVISTAKIGLAQTGGVCTAPPGKVIHPN